MGPMYQRYLRRTAVFLTAHLKIIIIKKNHMIRSTLKACFQAGSHRNKCSEYRILAELRKSKGWICVILLIY